MSRRRRLWAVTAATIVAAVALWWALHGPAVVAAWSENYWTLTRVTTPFVAEEME